ncbi:hypothetical protein MCOR25_003868 [Pyricularia grisea]|nr:hypothetical protein MCOR25_003868 [Pyricularia grisea]
MSTEPLGELPFFGLTGGKLTAWITIAWTTDMTLFGYDQFVTVLFVTVPWLPESPRWLLHHGRTDSTLQILAALEAMEPTSKEKTQRRSHPSIL